MNKNKVKHAEQNKPSIASLSLVIFTLTLNFIPAAYFSSPRAPERPALTSLSTANCCLLLSISAARSLFLIFVILLFSSPHRLPLPPRRIPPTTTDCPCPARFAGPAIVLLLALLCLIMYAVLKSKSEQERRLLTVLVNKSSPDDLL
ncbi:hypothetical protein RND81_14G106000 [Saponaria officinalis]|uniref:Transmembrane protein n=1 Tax=Saponaria officinalis TaxID=3572 RepID=A0AAW1GP90_SAPOF